MHGRQFPRPSECISIGSCARCGRGRHSALGKLCERLRQATQGCSRVLQGGRKRHYRQGQTGVRRQGQAKGHEKARAEAADEGREEDQSRLVPIDILAEPSNEAPPFLCPEPVYPPVH